MPLLTNKRKWYYNMERRNVFTKDDNLNELIRLYVDEDYNTVECAEHFGVTRSACRVALINANISVVRKNNKRRKTYLRKDINVDRINEMFDDNISIAQIAKQMNCDRSVIENRLIENGYSEQITRAPKKYSGIKSCYYKLYSKYRTNAAYRKHTFNLTEEEFFHLLQQPCHYCGKEPSQIVVNNGNSASYNGIDRVNNNIGYEVGNVVSCCGICNVMKQSFTEEEFFSHIKQIIAHCNY